MSQATIDRQRANGHKISGPPDLALEAPTARRRARVPEMLIGAALTIGFALAFVLWQAGSTDRRPVLALAVAVERGEVIEASDLEAVYVDSDASIAALDRSASAAVVGRPAAIDLAPGTVLTSSMVIDREEVGAGDGVVGLALDPGQFPTARLSPGDVVNVVASTADEGEIVLADRAIVYAIEDLGGQGRRFVSVRADLASANAVAAAVERGPVRLVLVGEDG